MRIGRPGHLHVSPLRPARIGTLASLTSSLLLGACSQSSNLLPSLAMKSSQTETSDITPAGPQTELQKATIYWGQQFAKNPADLKAALSYARDLKAMGQKKQALAVLQQASVFHGDDKELAGEYGRVALELDQVGAANQLLTVADDPTKPDWRIVSARGTVMAKQGKYSEAIPYYERALTLSQNNPSVLNNLAMAYALMGEPQKAEQILREALASDGAAPKVRENLALVLGLQGRYDESRSIGAGALTSEVAFANTDYLKQMVKLEPKSAPAEQGFQTEAVAAPKAAETLQSEVAQTDATVPREAVQSDAAEAWQTQVDTQAPIVRQANKAN